MNLVAECLERRSAHDLVRLAQELLLIEPEFESAFPRTRAVQRDDALDQVVRRIAARDRTASRLGGEFATAIRELNSPDDAPTAFDHRAARLRLVDRALETVHRMTSSVSAAFVVRAQRQWMFGDSTTSVADDLDRAAGAAQTPRALAAALLHLAILRADQTRLDDSLQLLKLAVRMHPDHVALRWTLGIYAAVAGEATLSEHELRHAATVAERRDLRRRCLALPQQLRAMHRRGHTFNTIARARLRSVVLLAAGVDAQGVLDESAI